jgi:hypothetical protein
MYILWRRSSTLHALRAKKNMKQRDAQTRIVETKKGFTAREWTINLVETYAIGEPFPTVIGNHEIGPHGRLGTLNGTQESVVILTAHMWIWAESGRETMFKTGILISGVRAVDAGPRIEIGTATLGEVERVGILVAKSAVASPMTLAMNEIISVLVIETGIEAKTESTAVLEIEKAMAIVVIILRDKPSPEAKTAILNVGCHTSLCDLAPDVPPVPARREVELHPLRLVIRPVVYVTSHFRSMGQLSPQRVSGRAYRRQVKVVS